MNMKKTSLLTVCILALCATIFAADIDGKWTGQVQGPQGAMDVTMVFKADGEKLTGTIINQMGEAALKEGSIKDNNVAFKVDREFNGMKFTVVYKGKLSGDELKLTRTIEGDFGGQTPPPVDFTLKRAK